MILQKLRLVFFILPMLLSTEVFANNSYFDKELKTVVCAEPLPLFTLSETSQPTDEEVAKLCSCIWKSFPAGGWEQQTSAKIRNDENPGWRGRALTSRFGSALGNCGGYDL